MTEITRTPTFGNLSDWLEGFQNETSQQMRRGMLEALFFKSNFQDSTGISKGKQILYLIEALSTTKNNEITICRGFDLAIEKVLWRPSGTLWPKGVSKQSIFELLKFVERFDHLPIDPVHFRKDFLKNFLESIVTFYPPDKNKAHENSLIIRSVIDCGQSSLLSYGAWRGHRLVIKEILKRLPKNSNPFGGGWRHVYSDLLAIHLAYSGHMDEVLEKFR